MRFYLSGNLLRFSDYDQDIEIEGDTLQAGLQGLAERYPPLKPVLFDASDEVRGVHQIFLDGVAISGEDIRKGVARDADVTILTALAGG